MPKVVYAGGSDNATWRLPVLGLEGRLELVDGAVKVAERTGKPDDDGRFAWQHRDLKKNEWDTIVASGDAARLGFVAV